MSEPRVVLSSQIGFNDVQLRFLWMTVKSLYLSWKMCPFSVTKVYNAKLIKCGPDWLLAHVTCHRA